MAQCSYNSISKFRHLGQDCDRIDSSPTSGADTLRERIFRNLLKKQLNVKLDLNVCLKNKNKFVSSTTQESVSEVTGGLKSLGSFKQISDNFNLREMLSSCQFDAMEIEYLISGKETLSGNSVHHSEKLEAMESKLRLRLDDLENRDQESFSGAVTLNRREFEDECKYFAGEVADKLTPLLVKLKPMLDPKLHRDHPMNKICELALELFPQEVEVNEETVRYSPRKKMKKEQKNDQMAKIRRSDSKPGSFWDMVEVPPVVAKMAPPIGVCPKPPRMPPIRVLVTEPPRIKPDFTKAFVWTLNPSQLVSLTDIEKNKASLEAIRSDPKFSNCPVFGNPSRTVFLKNLPRKVDPLEIVSLFGRFEVGKKTKNEYRLLGGRMKGQAFVKFCDLETSHLALTTCYGYRFEGKPLIMEYSKK